MRIVVAITAALAIAAMVFAGVAYEKSAHQEVRYNRKLAQDDRKIAGLQSRVAGLVGEISNPVDPLGAYNDICNQDLTNSSTGVDQTYYFPCTNSAQTIPQPGN